MFLELFLGVSLLILLWYWHDQRKYKDYPPGPLRFPVLGNLPQLAIAGLTSESKTASWIMHEISRVHGDIMHLKMGILDVVVFSSYVHITDFLNRDGVANRKMFQFCTDRNGKGNLGLILSSGEEWDTVRKFTIRTLREFGFGKSMSMSSVIYEEAEKYADYLKTKLVESNNTIHVEEDIFDLTVVNILWRLVTGKAYKLEDERAIQTLKLSNAYVRSIAIDDITICYPIIGELFPTLTGRVLRREKVEDLKAFISEIIQEHSVLDNEDCFIDVFLKEIKEDGKIFTHEQLVYTVLDMFQAGSETTSKTLTFCILHMIRNPKMQERAHQELISLGENVQDLNEMSKKLPYCFSIIMEVFRFSDVVPIPAPYLCHEDIKINGYTIKAGTTFMVNYDSVHYDKKIWGNPKKFQPERFLDDDGNVRRKLTEYVLPFSKGKRACPGQSLTESTLSIYFGVLFKTFKFELAPGESSPSAIPKPGLTYAPASFTLKVLAR